MMPLYGFLEGDTIGLLILAYESDTVADLAERLQVSARIRVSHKDHVNIIHKGNKLDPRLKVVNSGFEALDRFDVVSEGGSSGL